LPEMWTTRFISEISSQLTSTLMYSKNKVTGRPFVGADGRTFDN
jgi:hypothetical protein